MREKRHQRENNKIGRKKIEIDKKKTKMTATKKIEPKKQ